MDTAGRQGARALIATRNVLVRHFVLVVALASVSRAGFVLAQATGANLPYLQSQWCGTGFDRDPRARIRFGAYKNASEMIYLRELY